MLNKDPRQDKCNLQERQAIIKLLAKMRLPLKDFKFLWLDGDPVNKLPASNHQRAKTSTGLSLAPLFVGLLILMAVAYGK